MPTFFITTLGCKVNQFEAEAIGLALTGAGWEKTTKPASADICIINTCTVTGKASMQSRQAIRNIIRNSQNSKVIVTGCYAQTEADEIKTIDGVDSIISHTEKHRIPSMILDEAGELLPEVSNDCDSSCSETHFRQIDVDVHGNRTRPFLKIQDGCDAFCTYCIVPHSRGRSRSMDADDVIKKLKTLGDSGYLEVVLTGIHIGAWGNDLSSGQSFYDLLRLIDREKPVNRIRLSSIEPGEISDDIISLVAESDTFCNHFHIPLQSGDNTILKRMHRPYTREQFSHVVETIHKKIPDASIGIDTLVGFPGESDEEYLNTYSLIEGLPVTYLHVFPFSPRKKTPAASFPDQIHPDTKNKRTELIRQLGSLKKSAFLSSQEGKTESVLIETRRDRVSGFLKGLTSNYVTVLVDGPDILKNTIVPVSLQHHTDTAMIGIPRTET